MTNNKKILSIGIDPQLLDFTSPEFAVMPGLTAEKVSAGVIGSVNKLNELGYEAEWCWIDLGQTAATVIEAKLSATNYDGVIIGAGIRVPPSNLLLFEKLVNVIHQFAPKAKLCFNTNPTDTIEAVKRCL